MPNRAATIKEAEHFSRLEPAWDSGPGGLTAFERSRQLASFAASRVTSLDGFKFGPFVCTTHLTGLRCGTIEPSVLFQQMLSLPMFELLNVQDAYDAANYLSEVISTDFFPIVLSKREHISTPRAG